MLFRGMETRAMEIVKMHQGLVLGRILDTHAHYVVYPSQVITFAARKKRTDHQVTNIPLARVPLSGITTFVCTREW